jgi:hypothetical protein
LGRWDASLRDTLKEMNLTQIDEARAPGGSPAKIDL